jgi:hypothetical protein
MRHGTWWTVVAVGCTLLSADGLEAQDFSEPRGFVGLSFVAGNPVGDLGGFFDQSWGGRVEGSWAMSEDRRLRLRADLGAMIYGQEKIAMCHPAFGCRIGVDLTTTNNIFYGGVGPEVVFATGAFEPYVFGTMGFSYFATISSLSGADEYRDYFKTTNYSDVVMAWRVGGGTRVRVHRGSHPVSLDFAVERHQNGIANFLTKGDIVDNPDGTITLYPNRSEANLVAFKLGVSIGFGG